MVIWSPDQSGMWQPVELHGTPMELAARDGAPMVATEGMAEPLGLLYPWSDRFGATRYVLFPLALEALRVNGRQLFGHRLLLDRDEILFRCSAGGGRVFFTEKSLPRVVNFKASSGGGPPAFCLRCKTRIEEAQPVVLCPRCKVWYHQMEERLCWSYDKECANCHRTTAMDYAWKPEPAVGGRPEFAKRMALRRTARNEESRA